MAAAQQLVAALQQFTAVAPAGMVSREQYSGAGFTVADHAQSTLEGYNRAGNLKDVCNE